MKAAVLYKHKTKLKVLNNIQVPKLKSLQVLVRIIYTSICGSQVFEIEGKRGNNKFLPHMLGHEASGVILEIGKNVKHLKVGDKVFLSWIKNDHEDAEKPLYIFKKKRINAGNITTFSNVSIISSNRVNKIPKGISFREATLLGCALPTGAGMVLKQNIKKNHKILIIGLGGVGISSLISVLSINKNIYAIEKNKKRIDFLKKKIKKKINIYSNFNFIKKNSYDFIFESSGDSKVISKSLNYLKSNGKLIFASHPKYGDKIKIDPFNLIIGKKIQGTWGGGINFKKDLNKLTSIIKKNKNIDDIFFNKVYNLNKINLAVNDLKIGKVIRPLIKL
tara:strand:+ start:196 stop:1197 length:1002 start_codon:yes stop_codon:yes gene_type:complete